MLRLYLRNTLLSPVMPVAMIALYLSMAVSVWPFDTCDLLYLYQYTISLGFTSFFIPVVSVLPVCYFQHTLASGRFTSFCLLRSTKRSYTWAVCFGAVISGMAVMAGAFVLFTITCLLYSPEGTPYFGTGLFSYDATFFAPLTAHPFLLYLVMGGIFTLNGAMWPMISLLCFSVTSNQYIVASVPFIVRTGMGYFAQSMGIYVLDPAQLLLKGIAMQWSGGGVPYLLLYTGIVAVVCGGIWTFREYGRIRHG